MICRTALAALAGLAAAPVLAAPITLSCAGTVTRNDTTGTHTDNVFDVSLVVDLDRKVVGGSALPWSVPISGQSDAVIFFDEDRRDPSGNTLIGGGVDRVTGRANIMWLDGHSVSTTISELHCHRTAPKF